MVIHEDSFNAHEVKVTQMPRSERKKFIVVDNHVREIPIVKESSSSTNTENDPTESECINKKKKRIKKQLGTVPQEKNEAEISASDLQELKTVYLKCKEVVERIENKYGHLLNLDGANSSRQHKRKLDDEIEQCACETNKKIVFDDNGEQKLVDAVTSNHTHICANKLKSPEHNNIKITYENTEPQLPDSIQELQNLLRNPDLGYTHRYQIVYKLRSLRQEVSNEIKFNKPSLIEELKKNPEEILDFKGTNLASIPGYL